VDVGGSEEKRGDSIRSKKKVRSRLGRGKNRGHLSGMV